MNTDKFRGRMPIKKLWGLPVSLIASLAIVSPAFGATAPTPPPVPPIDESTCANPSLSQALLAFGDLNLYTLAPGGAFANAADWQLTTGATIAPGVQPDGSAGSVLQLQSKAMATSPVMCITRDYPMARVWGRNAKGGDNVSLNVQYYDKATGQWTKPKDQGGFDGDRGGKWKLSGELPITPDPANLGWQQVRFTFYAGGRDSIFQVDNFWVDPRASR